MNCKPGDLAVVVGRCDVCGDYLIGRIFKVTNSFVEFGNALWQYEGPTLQTPWGPLEALADKKLRPIHDPGEDATDEMILRLGSPNKQKVPA